MHADRRSKAYELGVEGFLNFAVENLGNTTHIHCPCVKCENIRLFGVGIIRDHLYFNGIDQSYKIWAWHGERWEWTTNASRNVEEDEQSMFNFVSEEVGMDDNDLGDIGFDPYEFSNVIGDGDQPLYPGSSVLLWTVNDFPVYGNLSGCVVKGYKACPICGDDTPSHRQRAAFNGKPEHGTPPEPLNGEEVLHMVEDINYIWGSKNGGSVGENDGDRVCWKKKSKFFDLEYWKYLHVRHVLDVMHIEKNVCDSIIGTLLEIPGKNKDGIAAWLDLLNMGVKTDLQPEYGQRRTCLPPGPWNLSRAKKKAVCNSFYGMKVPKGYCLNIKNLVSLKDSRLLGLKFHDCHTLMQQLLPVAIHYVLEKPARYMKVLKGYVQNCTRSEGCIAERYIAEEAVEFCIEHLSDVSTVGVPSSQKMGVSKPLSGCIVSLVDRDLLNQAHLYVLEYTGEVLPYIEEHMIHIKTTYPKFRKRIKWLQDKHNSTFIQWLHFKVQSELNGEEHNGISENLRLASNWSKHGSAII
ncbi:hypothetical protein L3X38_018599 [Prunus dulcis]|uniref:Transposase-associated domain-containing protein n=1 Tax=Prunus dulcis TaxID=3755 RepID=A0AAD4WBK3_PRUDU|nr:hypothetical protein L3X38_018599 [Prunus dulcis]